MKRLSNRINRLAESATIAMSRKSRELKAQGLDVIALSLGEPDFSTPDFIKEAAHKAIADNYTHYTPVPGYPELREAISKKFSRDNGLHYTTDQVMASTGAKQVIANVVMSLIDKGDEVIVPAPFWVTYLEIIKMANGAPVIVPASIETDFKITPEQLENAINKNTRMMIFSSPCNPTGTVYTRTELEALAEVIARYPDLTVIADEIYEHILFTGQHVSLAEVSHGKIFDQVVTVNGVSKAFAMTGWRVGYLGGPKWITDACIKMQGQFTSGTCGIAQKAAEAALLADPKVTEKMREAFHARRDLVLELLDKIPGLKRNKPEGAFYVFPDVTAFFGKTAGAHHIRNADDLSMYLLNVAHVAVVTGTAFGDPSCIRISYANSEATLKEAMARIAKALDNLK